MCDFFSLLKLACSAPYRLATVVAANRGATCKLIFSMLLNSYTVILSSLKSHGSEGRHTALFKCGSYFTVVVPFFSPCVLTYMSPMTSYSVDEFVIMLFAILTPMLNPLIYSLRNKDVKEALRKILGKKLFLFNSVLTENRSK